MAFDAVLFDLGGVVLESPFTALREYERTAQLPEGFINRVIAERGDVGAWARFERGEVDFDAFCQAFEAETGGRVDAARLMEAIGRVTQVRPRVLAAVDDIRSAGWKVAAVTNNWVAASAPLGHGLQTHFDVFVESTVEGVNKPDPRIFEIALARLGVAAADAVFLDDIGRNLRSAQTLGMATIKVVDPDEALEALWELLGYRPNR